jgi:hypothetical protein
MTNGAAEHVPNAVPQLVAASRNATEGVAYRSEAPCCPSFQFIEDVPGTSAGRRG